MSLAYLVVNTFIYLVLFLALLFGLTVKPITKHGFGIGQFFTTAGIVAFGIWCLVVGAYVTFKDLVVMLKNLF